MDRCRNARRRGFTLVELLISLAIVAVLAAFVTPMIVTAVKREKEQALRTALRQIRQAIDDYADAIDEGRIARAPGASRYPESLDVLVLGAVDRLDPSGGRIRFLRRVPRDPFFPDDRVPAADTWGKVGSDVPVDRPGPGRDVFDVFSLSDAVGINGVPYRQW